jgi:multidrug efflux pump subunit AcrB
MQQSQSSNGAPADLAAAAVAAAAATVATTVRKNAQRKASTGAGMAGKQTAWAQASVGQDNDLKAVPDQGSLAHLGSLGHRWSLGRLMLQLFGKAVVFLWLLLLQLFGTVVALLLVVVKAGKTLVKGVIDALERKGAWVRPYQTLDLKQKEADSKA